MIEPPGLSVCWRFVDLINRKKLIKFLGKVEGDKFSKMNPNDTGIITFVVDKVPLDKIFEFIPPVKFPFCRVRYPNNYNSFAYKNERDCERLLPVTRTLFSEVFCYRTHLAVDKNFDFKTVANAMSFKGLIFQNLFPYELFDDGVLNWLMPVVHPRTGNGDDSRMYSNLQPAGSRDRNFFKVSYSIISRTLLPAPYDTKCYAAGGYNVHECIKRCLVNRTTDYMNRLPFTLLFSEKDARMYTGYRLIDPHILNTTENELLVQFSQECFARCPQTCTDTDYITSLEFTHKVTALNGISFQLSIPSRPSINIEHKPSLPFNEYVIYVLSCLGTWLGVSVIGLNPFAAKCPCKSGNKRDKDLKIRCLYRTLVDLKAENDLVMKQNRYILAECNNIKDLLKHRRN